MKMKRNTILLLFATVFLLSCGNNTTKRLAQNDSTEVATEAVVEETSEVEEYGVDLGLSVNWAECNVGANSPEEVGYCVPLGNVTGTTKAPKNPKSVVSGTNSDIAVVKLGNGWRMPTGAEMMELREKCSWTVETVNGRNGFRVTGPNGNSIFFKLRQF